jgi:hypothetical protein
LAVDKLATWALVGLLGYICLLLTSISQKLDAFNLPDTEVAILNEVKPQSFRLDEIHSGEFQKSASAATTPVSAFFLLSVTIFAFVSWHMSRIFHTRQWTNKALRTNIAPYHHPHVAARPREPIHPDQDCVSDPPMQDGGIKPSWLPDHARQNYVDWRGRAERSSPDS